MLLLIYKLDSDTNASPVCVLKEGEHVIGRGEILKVSKTPKRSIEIEVITVFIMLNISAMIIELRGLTQS